MPSGSAKRLGRTTILRETPHGALEGRQDGLALEEIVD